MDAYSKKIFIGTILIEPNRHTRDRSPSLKVSEWIPRFKEAGFDGMELWEYHAIKAVAAELDSIRKSSFPVSVFSSYVRFEDELMEETRDIGRVAKSVGASGIKFNIGRDPAKWEMYVNNVLCWGDGFDDDVRLLCECHSGTLIEKPENARKAFLHWTDPKFHAIVHPFQIGTEELRRWFEVLGPDVITHAHVRIEDKEQRSLRLDRRPEAVREAIRILHGEGFKGSMTLEFTEGSKIPGEDPDKTFEAAKRDLEFLREHWA